MRHPAFVLLALLVVASSATSGFLVGRSQVAPGRGDHANVVEEYDQEVGFSREQRATVEKIIGENHPRFVSVRAKVEPELAAVRSDVRAKMRAVLREDQLARFDAYCAKRDRLRAERDR